MILSFVALGGTVFLIIRNVLRLLRRADMLERRCERLERELHGEGEGGADGGALEESARAVSGDPYRVPAKMPRAYRPRRTGLLAEVDRVQQAVDQAQRMLPHVDPTGRMFPHGFEDIGKPMVMPPMPPLSSDLIMDAMRTMVARRGELLRAQEEKEKEQRRLQAATKWELELRLDRVIDQVEKLTSRVGSMRYEDD